MRRYIFLLGIIICLQFHINNLIGQTIPVAQSLPYIQDFASITSPTVTTYPLGWQGWQLSTGGSSNNFRTTAPTSNIAMTASGTASSATSGVYNYAGKIGFLASGISDPALCLVVNTIGQNNVSVTFDIGNIRNPYNNTTETKRNNLELQFRVGNTVGSFTSLTGSIYRNNTTNQTTTTTIPQNVIRYRFLLPASCDGQPEVQLRWVQRDSVGSGSRPSFSIDNVIVCVAPMVTATVSPSCSGQKNGSIVLNITGGMAPYNVVWDTINTTNGPNYSVSAMAKSSQHPYFGVGFSMGFVIDGIQGKELTTIRGVTYSFNGTFAGHPFHISTSSSGGTFANEVTSGTTNNFMQGGVLNFTPNTSHADSVWYQCGFHLNMGWKIRISNGYSTQNLTNINAGTYTAAVKTADGCISNITVTVGSVSLPVITVGNNGPGCLGDSTQLNSSGGTSYLWSGPNSFSSSLQNPIVFNNSLNSGYYKVVVTNVNGCTKKDSTQVSFLPGSTVIVTNSGTYCIGDTTQLSATGGGTYLWSGPSSFSSSLQNPKIYNAGMSNSGYYKVVVTSANGCTKTDSTQVTILLAPTASVSNNGPQCLGLNTQLSAIGGVSYLWFGPNGYSSSLQNPFVSNESSNEGFYKVIVTNSNGCSKMDSTQITFLPTPSIFSFSPDSGYAGDNIFIIGTGFSNTFNVSFNGFTSPFQVDNDNMLTTSVPANANFGTINITNNIGCAVNSSLNFRPLHSVPIHLHVLIEGFYQNGAMIPVSDPINYPFIADSITVFLFDPNHLSQEAVPGVTDVINLNGNGTFVFPESVLNQTYYLVIKHRNSIETWSKYPVLITGNTSFDFSIPE